METRANYLLIGLFALAGLAGALVLLLWLASVQVSRQFAYYDVLFPDVSGLGMAGDVRFNGLPVGSVVALDLDPDDPSQVRVRLEVDASTPIKTDTIAKLESLGITGVSFVGLSGGSPEAPRLESGGVIPSERSAIASIFEGAPQLLERGISLLEDMNQVFDDTNRAAVADILDNLASASGRLDQVLSDAEGLTANLGDAAQEVAGFTDRLRSLSDTAETTLNAATDTLGTAREAITQAETAITAAGTAFETADGLIRGDLAAFVQRGASVAETLDSTLQTLEPAALATLEATQRLAETRIPELVDQLNATADTLDTQLAAIGPDVTALVNRYDDVGAALLARVDQAERAITAFETATNAATSTLSAVERASDSATRFIEDDGRPLAAEATAALAGARAFTADRLPGLADQAGSTMATIEREVATLSTGAQDTIGLASARLTEVAETLRSLDATLTQATSSMVSVEEASDYVYELFFGDGTELVAEARTAVTSAQTAIDTINAAVADDLPALLENVRTAAETANRVMDVGGRDFSQIAANIDTLTAEGGPALAAATETFANANATLAAITDAMDAATGTLGTAEQTFTSVNTVIDEDLDPVIENLTTALSTFTGTVETASINIDAISTEVLQASRSASNFIGNIDTIVDQNRIQVSDFLRTGLPQFLRFIEESRLLVGSLDRLVQRIGRDPARFLLNNQGSEFRR